ncbi:hypothetical protein GCM10010441_39000 [Kitasatospora paracochleata]
MDTVSSHETEGTEMTEMTASTLHSAHSADTFHTRPPAARRPSFWLAPFAPATYREIGYTLTSLPTAVFGFSVMITLFCTGAGLTVTVLGLPVLALMLTTARGLGAFERGRARTLLDTDVPGPRPVSPTRTGIWGAITARLADAAGWKAALYQVIMFPWAVLSFCLSVTFLLTGWVYALYPLYHWVFARFTPWPGYRVFDYTDSSGVQHDYYITRPWQITGISLVGLILVFLTPQIVRGLTNVHRLAIRGLLSTR